MGANIMIHGRVSTATFLGKHPVRRERLSCATCLPPVIGRLSDKRRVNRIRHEIADCRSRDAITESRRRVERFARRKIVSSIRRADSAPVSFAGTAADMRLLLAADPSAPSNRRPDEMVTTGRFSFHPT